jgi:16S rRNA (cytosine1402-N4)-methyltransferase
VLGTHYIRMHLPVLQKETLLCLDPRPNQNFVDCTFGQGGHSCLILERTAPRGKVLAIEQDQEEIASCKLKIRTFKQRLTVVCDNFENLQAIVRRARFSRINGILFDLGLSSWQLADSGRGFTFQKKEPLDMRYSSENQLTAEKIVNFWSRFDLERILSQYGEEKFAPQIVSAIMEERKLRPIKDTLHLAEIVKKAVRSHQKIHPATRTFQALRIAVNNELERLEKALPQALEVLSEQGRIVVISFHSLEDRIVKNFFREQASLNELKILTKKPITANYREIKTNPRSRSAKLRAAQKI